MLFHRARQEEPLCLLHYTALQNLRRISVLHLDRLLHEDAPAVRDFIDQMDSSARHLHAAFQRRLMHAQAVIALAAEGRDERRMNIDNPIAVRMDDRGAEDGQKACQNDKLRTTFLQRCKDRRVIRR